MSKVYFGEVNQHITKPKGNVREAIAKLSRGLMLPIAMLPIAGLFLGIGATIINLTSSHSSALYIFGNILNTTGSAIFSALPCLFAIAIAISFTKDSGTAGLSAFVG
jgi:PTS system glucose-specific IIC component